MASHNATNAINGAHRQRRAHTKSRRGCSSCKTRRVKCDEQKPTCQQCRSFGVSCAYGSKAIGLTFEGESSFDLNDSFAPSSEASGISVPVAQDAPLICSKTQRLSQSSAIIEHCNGLPSPPDSDGEENSHNDLLGMATLEVLKKFNERTVLSVGTPQVAKIYQKEVFHLACYYPFLRDIVITLTLLHDRHLSGTQTISRTILSHWFQGTANFKKILMQPLRDESRDALWASAALLGVIQFACFEARRPEEAWPLRPSDATDLDWLKMSDGKKAVLSFASPLRVDSEFRKMSINHNSMFHPTIELLDHSKPETVGLTRDFYDMFDIGPTSTGHYNPYYKPAMIMARLLHIECDSENMLQFFGFMMHMSPDLKTLLGRKDAKALLLVVYWYAKLHRGQWWIHHRGLIEGQSICMYLDKYHGDNAKLQRMLQWPKAEFDLEVSPPETLSMSEWSTDAASVLCVM